MASTHWHISMLACILLYACSDPSTSRTQGDIAATPGSTLKKDITMTHRIQVTISPVKAQDGTLHDEVSTVPANNVSAPGFNSGDTVIWEFDRNVAEHKLAVRPKGFEPFKDFPTEKQIRGQISRNPPGENKFEYEISRGGVDLDWADGANGGCIKPIGG